LNRKHTGSYPKNLHSEKKFKFLRKIAHLHPQKISSWKESKAIKGRHARVITIKSKSSSKINFWGSPDLSPGIEKLFNAINLCEYSKSLIIYIDLCSIKHMIHLSNWQSYELRSVFSRRDLWDSNFQDVIIKAICLGKSFSV
jgi:hypothetical protein